MKNLFAIIILSVFISCGKKSQSTNDNHNPTIAPVDQSRITNNDIKTYVNQEMELDSTFLFVCEETSVDFNNRRQVKKLIYSYRVENRGLFAKRTKGWFSNKFNLVISELIFSIDGRRFSTYSSDMYSIDKIKNSEVLKRDFKLLKRNTNHVSGFSVDLYEEDQKSVVTTNLTDYANIYKSFNRRCTSKI